MSLTDKQPELQRLIEAFERESEKFPAIEFHTYHVTQEKRPFLTRPFAKPNHAIMLWQYYGLIRSKEDLEQFGENLKESDLQWGLRGSAMTLMGVIEGETTPLFVRMATRAGSLFSLEE